MKVFVSSVFEDGGSRASIDRWAREGRLGLVEIVGETRDVRQQGFSAIRGHLAPLLQDSGALVVLIGQDTHNHEWVEYEISHCRSARKPVILVRIPGTTGAPPPSALGLALTTFEPGALRKALGT